VLSICGRGGYSIKVYIPICLQAKPMKSGTANTLASLSLLPRSYCKYTQTVIHVVGSVHYTPSHGDIHRHIDQEILVGAAYKNCWEI